MSLSRRNAFSDSNNLAGTNPNHTSTDLIWPRKPREVEDMSTASFSTFSASDPVLYSCSDRSSLNKNEDTDTYATPPKTRRNGKARSTLCTITCPICGPNAASKLIPASELDFDIETKLRVEKWLESIPLLPGYSLQRQYLSEHEFRDEIRDDGSSCGTRNEITHGGDHADEMMGIIPLTDGDVEVHSTRFFEDGFREVKSETALSQYGIRREDGRARGEEGVHSCRDDVGVERRMCEVERDLLACGWVFGPCEAI